MNKVIRIYKQPSISHTTIPIPIPVKQYSSMIHFGPATIFSVRCNPWHTHHKTGQVYPFAKPMGVEYKYPYSYTRTENGPIVRVKT